MDIFSPKQQQRIFLVEPIFIAKRKYLLFELYILYNTPNFVHILVSMLNYVCQPEGVNSKENTITLELEK